MIRLKREPYARVAVFNDPDTPCYWVLGIHGAEGFTWVWKDLRFRERVESATRGIRGVGWAVAPQNSAAPPSVSQKVYWGRMLQSGAYEATSSVLQNRAR